MASLLNTFINRAKGPYQKWLGQRLRVYGLKYDDIIIEKPVMMTALSRVDASTKQDRERRIARAFDLSAKRKYLAPEVAAAYDPFEHYLQDNIKVAELESDEKVYLRE
eukprot:GDKK01051672.1.p2 GENE.GDKK01051672.1~~GDKK01051672.1.p2  ORF type:complete len:108 (-),score=19.73 GDKK01051672.1:93-416(-)